MVRKRSSSAATQQPEQASAGGLTAALEALARATQKLRATATPMAPVAPAGQPFSAAAQQAEGGEQPVKPVRPRRDAEDSEAQAFYRQLEQRGELVDVTRDTDLSTLPPSVTHVRWPDGRVERIGFSAG